MKRSAPTIQQLRDALPRRSGGRLARAASVEDIRLLARRRVPRAVFDYVDGGAERETSLARSREAYGRVEFTPTAMAGASTIDLGTDILGRSSALPVVLAPTGFTRMMHHSGEASVALAAAQAGLPYALSTMGTTSIEALAAAAPDARRWFQLYIWRDRQASADFINRAAIAGFDALIVTVDTPVGGSRLRDVRNGMTIPPAPTTRTVLDAARHPRWWVNLLTTDPLEFAALSSFDGQVADLASQVFDPSVTWSDLAAIRAQWKGHLIVKGILSVEDAVRAVDNGADAVVVSNHGGRQLDRAPVPLEILPDVVNQVGGRAEVHVDGGVLSGADVAAAVGMGAHAVWIGRAYLYGLMAAGPAGVARVLELLTTEMRTTLALIGASSTDELAGRARVRP
ncbi:alpha-hydroxy acid oxidase [Aeromicrobium panaciterrae]|uniref:alpha-hydroxy acid oxidase n=1 Tax=Aeromicrobium panaciterrae TaxID=363861 RepID=UPI0031E0DCCB